MRNRLSFLTGFIFSCFFSYAAFNFVANFNPTQPMIAVALATPHKDVTTFPVAYTAKDLKCLQENIFFEARNQEILGMTLVGAVTMQRTQSPEFPASICEVVYQKAQFSWTNHKHKLNLNNVIEARAWNLSGKVAKAVLTDNGKLDELYKGVVYYHKTTVHPKWSTKMQKEFVFKDHIFYSKAMHETPRLVLR